MPWIYRALLVFALLGIYAVNADCGDNGGAVLGWGTQAAADVKLMTELGFSSSGPFDVAGNPLLSVISTNGGTGHLMFSAFICGQVNPDGAPQSTFGPVVSEDSMDSQTPFCLTASALTGSNITVALLPCVYAPHTPPNDISVDPVPTQTFEWITTHFVTYGFAFVGDQSAEAPLDPTKPIDYVPSLVGGVQLGSYVSFDFVPGGLPASTGRETGLILGLEDC
ncbi:hypothetical protein C8R44DRAFT_866416 [Mycena epipterygia]|nr:hypothetical protein C8R44DRAFT_866416 [Mycena epipterygia]